MGWHISVLFSQCVIEFFIICKRGGLSVIIPIFLLFKDFLWNTKIFSINNKTSFWRNHTCSSIMVFSKLIF